MDAPRAPLCVRASRRYVARLLGRQIRLGRELAYGGVPAYTCEEYRSAVERWDAFNVELLRQRFDPPEDLWRYEGYDDIDSFAAALAKGGQALFDHQRGVLRQRLSLLESLRERLPLIPELIAPRSAPTRDPAAGGDSPRAPTAPGGQRQQRLGGYEATAETFWTLYGKKREDDAWDYKRDVGLRDRPAFARLAKDIIALANVGGGALLLGVADDHQLVGVEQHPDPAELHDALEKRLGVRVDVSACYFTHLRGDRAMELGILAVGPSDGVLTVERTWHGTDNAVLLAEGDVYVRRGTRTVKALKADYDKILARTQRLREEAGDRRDVARSRAEGPVPQGVSAAESRGPVAPPPPMAPSPGVPTAATVVGRFLEIFQAHGVERTQIHRLVDARFRLKLADFRSDEALLERLDDDLLQWTTQFFGARRPWLDGVDDQIYDPPDFYQHVDGFVDLLFELAARGCRPLVDAFKTVLVLDRTVDDRSQYVGLVASVEIAQLGHMPVCRYVPIDSDWVWGYRKSRYQFKAIIHLCETLDVFVPGYDLDPDTLGRLIGGYVFPRAILDKASWRVTWHPDEYADLGSMVAKEVDEASSVFAYIAKCRLVERLGTRRLPPKGE